MDNIEVSKEFKSKRTIARVIKIICEFGDGKTEFHTRDIEHIIRQLELKTASEKAAIQSQKEQFEEMDKQIQSLKAAIIQGETWSDNFEITELKAEIIRLKGKVKEAWFRGMNASEKEFYHSVWEQWSKDNQIE